MAGEPFGPVIVGVDRSTDLATVVLAAEEAMARVAPLVVTHIHRGHLTDTETAAARQFLDVAASRARAEHPGLAVTTALVEGDPADELIRAGNLASLLVLERPHRRGPVIIASDSVATSVARRADVPVLLYAPMKHAAEVEVPPPVVLGVGGTPTCDAVVEYAFSEAALRGAVLSAIHVWSIEGEPQPSVTEARAAAAAALDETLSRWMEKCPQVRVRRILRYSPDVSLVLAAASQSGQLLVVGTHHSADAFVPALVHQTGCPVALVPVQSTGTTPDLLDRLGPTLELHAV
jgi:nucleotide-binding universal stress UspA family protein